MWAVSRENTGTTKAHARQIPTPHGDGGEGEGAAGGSSFHGGGGGAGRTHALQAHRRVPPPPVDSQVTAPPFHLPARFAFSSSV